MILAHAGGLDEILLAAAAVALIILLRRPRGTERTPREGPCLYCGRDLRAEDARCPSCGFRARPGPTSSASDEER